MAQNNLNDHIHMLSEKAQLRGCTCMILQLTKLQGQKTMMAAIDWEGQDEEAVCVAMYNTGAGSTCVQNCHLLLVKYLTMLV